ncbi:MAG: hypothetical protein WCK46_00660 [Candidatus Adlerbacteria bacterium]
MSESDKDREAQERIRGKAAKSMELMQQEFGGVAAAEAAHARGEEVKGRLGTLFPTDGTGELLDRFFGGDLDIANMSDDDIRGAAYSRDK